MKHSLKGALLSGLVFPGFGQVVLKYYKRGVILMLTVLASMMFMVFKAVRLALAILQEIELEGGSIDIAAVSESVVRAVSSTDSLTYNLAFYLIVICWVFGTVDAYRIGKNRDLEAADQV